jgi:hypothetical protein
MPEFRQASFNPKSGNTVALNPSKGPEAQVYVGESDGEAYSTNVVGSLSYLRRGKRRGGYAMQQIVDPAVVFNNQYFAARRSGLDHSQSYSKAMGETTEYVQKNSKYIRPEHMDFVSRSAIKEAPMAHDPNAPTPENHGARPFQGTQRAGKNVLAHGLGTTHRDAIQQVGQQAAPEGVEYTSIDGKTYSVSLSNPSTRGMTLLMHAIAEMVKGGSPVNVFGPAGVTLKDAVGEQVIDYYSMFEPVEAAPAAPESDVDGMSFGAQAE